MKDGAVAFFDAFKAGGGTLIEAEKETDVEARLPDEIIEEIRRIGRNWLDKGKECAKPESIADLR